MSSTAQPTVKTYQNYINGKWTASSGGQISSTVNAARVVQMALKLYF